MRKIKLNKDRQKRTKEISRAKMGNQILISIPMALMVPAGTSSLIFHFRKLEVNNIKSPIKSHS